MKWSSIITRTNSQKYFLQKEKSEIAFLDHISYFEIRRKNTLLAFSQQVASFEKNFLSLLQKRKIIKKKQFIIIMFSKINKKKFQNN
jgi:hypothetical protein